MLKHERRSNEIEVRSEGRVISGYAAKWNCRSNLLGPDKAEDGQEPFYEVLEPYCFDLADSVFLTYEHSDGDILDRSDGGTLEVRQDDVGLRFRATLPQRSPTIDVDGLIEQIQRKVLRGMSFTFDVMGKDGVDWRRLDDGVMLRSIKRAALFGICVTPCPAYENTEVAVRSLKAHFSRESQAEANRRLHHATRSYKLRRLIAALHR
jgi:hypothetical protein